MNYTKSQKERSQCLRSSLASVRKKRIPKKSISKQTFLKSLNYIYNKCSRITFKEPHSDLSKINNVSKVCM